MVQHHSHITSFALASFARRHSTPEDTRNRACHSAYSLGRLPGCGHDYMVPYAHPGTQSVNESAVLTSYIKRLSSAMRTVLVSLGDWARPCIRRQAGLSLTRAVGLSAGFCPPSALQHYRQSHTINLEGSLFTYLAAI